MLMTVGKWLSVRLTAAVPALILISGLALAAPSDKGEPSMGTTGEHEVIVPITVRGKTVQAHVADSEARRRQGLLGWSTITDTTGMLLDFVQEESGYAIHMQGMQFPIDALWIDAEGIIRFIYEDIPSNSGRIYPAMFPCRYCLEVKAGFCRRSSIRVGDRVHFGAADQ
jgi:uncharacterized protein